jgi:excisionase family DNA binding protein
MRQFLFAIARLLARQAALEDLRAHAPTPETPDRWRTNMTPNPSRLPRLLTIAGVAEQCLVSTKTVRRWIARGELPVHQLGRQIRVSESDLFAHLEQRRR